MTKFDVFLSHNSIDKPWASRLKQDLERYGLAVWLDRDEIRPGDLFAKALEAGLASSRAVALIISPEAMASGWVEEEYYRALSLTKNKAAPLQLIPVLLREAKPPDFVTSRDWIDFRDEAAYAERVWELVWGITGHKPAEVLDLAAPPASRERPASAAAAPTPVLATPAAPPTFRSGGVKAGGKIQAENIVVGAQIQGDDAGAAAAFLGPERTFEAGSVEAGQDIIAKNIVAGFQVLGRGGGEPTREQFIQELEALRQQLAGAVAAREIEDEYAAEDAQTAVERALAQSRAEPPAAEKISRQLERAADIIDSAAETAQAAGKLGATVLKLAPVVAALKQLVEVLF
jgi:hypothetical protein